MDNDKIASILLCIVGSVIVLDTFLTQFFSIGTEQKSLRLGYCIAFILLTIKFPPIVKKKYVIIPLYLMMTQMFYSLYLRFF